MKLVFVGLIINQELNIRTGMPVPFHSFIARFLVCKFSCHSIINIDYITGGPGSPHGLCV